MAVPSFVLERSVMISDVVESHLNRELNRELNRQSSRLSKLGCGPVACFTSSPGPPMRVNLRQEGALVFRPPRACPAGEIVQEKV